MGSAGSKVWAELQGRPVLWHSVRALAQVPGMAEIIVVGAPGEQERVSIALRECVCTVHWVVGGARRQDSALAGLRAARGAYVLMHDAARPLAGAELAVRVLSAARVHGAAVPAVPVVDTLRYVSDAARLIGAGPDRIGLVHIQTPQGFAREPLLAAYQAAKETGGELTDDAAAVLAAGGQVAMVAGARANLKITQPEDLELARRLLGR